MTTVAPSSTVPDAADVELTESDLARRLEMLTGETDLVVVLGMIAARIVDVPVLDDILDDDERPSGPLDLDRYGLPAAEFARFQRLWYHFRVPYARASLVWWYLFCLSLRGGGRVADALETMADLLGRLTGPQAAARLAADELGLAAGPVVVTADETGDVPALIRAVRSGVPLLAVADVPAAVAAGRAAGVDVVTSRPGPGPHPEPWLGRPVELSALPGHARRSWRELPDEQRGELLAQLGQRVTSIERLRLLLDDEPVDNKGMAAVLARCGTGPVDGWSPADLALATLMRCWHEAGFVLQELNQTFVTFPAVAAFLTRRIREYRQRLGERDAQPEAADDVLALARELAEVRQRVEQRYERCLHFDGSNWERREFLLPLTAYRRVDDAPDSLRERLSALTGADLPRYGDDYLAAWDTFLERALERGTTPTRVMQELAHWMANTPDLWADLAVVTVPIGTRLDEPWAMVYSDLFAYTGFRDAFDPAEFGVPQDRVGMQNVLGQRMRYNAVKKAQNYAPVRRFPPQGFNLPDIAIAEDANHAGHTATGVRLACRVPITVRYGDRDWNGLADVRLNRADYRREHRFRPRDLVTAYRYAQWVKGVADATYRRGLCFDPKWGARVTDLDI